MRSFDSHPIRNWSPRQQVASVWPSLYAPIYQAILLNISELPAISPDKRAGHGASCLGKSWMKQRLGYDSTHLMRAANAAVLIRAIRKKGPLGGARWGLACLDRPWERAQQAGIGVRPGNPTRYPYSDQDPGRSARWKDEYDQKSEAFATCSLLAELGPRSIHPSLAAAIQLHGAATKISSNLPLA
jgi:hypothetical protein